MTESSCASIESVYAVRLGSSFSLGATMSGRSRESARWDVMGVQIRPEVWRTMKDILAGVMSSAAMMRSPSFSREVSSITTMNSPRAKAARESGIESNWSEVDCDIL